MKPYTLDLRQKVMAAVEAGRGTQREIAELFDVSRTFVQSLVHSQRDRGTIEAKVQRHGPEPTIRGEHEEMVREYIRQHNDATLDETRDYLLEATGTGVSHPTMSRALARMGLGRKKKSYRARTR